LLLECYSALSGLMRIYIDLESQGFTLCWCMLPLQGYSQNRHPLINGLSLRLCLAMNQAHAHPSFPQYHHPLRPCASAVKKNLDSKLLLPEHIIILQHMIIIPAFQYIQMKEQRDGSQYEHDDVPNVEEDEII
jgi:hypothetical protein